MKVRFFLSKNCCIFVMMKTYTVFIEEKAKEWGYDSWADYMNFCRDQGLSPDEIGYDSIAIEFAEFHVKEALKSASEKVTMNLTYPSPYEDSNESGLTFASADEISRGGEYGSVEVDKESILTSYVDQINPPRVPRKKRTPGV